MVLILQRSHCQLWINSFPGNNCGNDHILKPRRFYIIVLPATRASLRTGSVGHPAPSSKAGRKTQITNDTQTEHEVDCAFFVFGVQGGLARSDQYGDVLLLLVILGGSISPLYQWCTAASREN